MAQAAVKILFDGSGWEGGKIQQSAGPREDALLGYAPDGFDTINAPDSHRVRAT